MPDFLDGIFIGEMLVDNPSGGGSGTDTDGDGGNTKADEYVEIQNASGASISLDGYEIWSEDRGLLYQFDPGDTIGAGQTATVVGEHTGTPPPGFYDAGNSNTHNFLEDGEGSKNDSIFLVNTDTGEYVVFSYGNPPQAPSLPTGFPGTTQVGSGETLNSTGPNNIAFVRNADGDFVEGAPNPGTAGPVCYARGSMIKTVRGEIPVEDLCVGDSLVTADTGAQPIRQIIVTHRCFLTGPHQHKPIEFKPGSLGGGRPKRRLIVSPQHRMLFSGPVVQEMFGEQEVLALAKGLLGLPHVRAMNGKCAITYFSLLCDRHEVVEAEGAWSETFHPGVHALRMIGISARREVEALFPRLTTDPDSYGPHARRVLNRKETEALVEALLDHGFGSENREITRSKSRAEYPKWEEYLAREKVAVPPSKLRVAI